MNWAQKLTSRKFWLAVAALVVGVITLTKPGTDTTQITGLILSLGSVVAYIVGEGLVDAAAAGAGDTAAGTVPQYNAPVVGTVSTDTPDTASTGAAQAAEVKQETAGSGK